MFNSENTLKTDCYITIISTMHILLKDLIIALLSYNRNQHAIILDLDLIRFYLNIEFKNIKIFNRFKKHT